MKIATLQYKFGILGDFSAFNKKVSSILERCAQENVDLVLFPEYAGLEAGDSAAYAEVFQKLSEKYGVIICSGTNVVKTPEGSFNRAYLFSPSRKMGYQDKCNLTPDEVEEGILQKGNEVKIFATSLGKIGICVCYDSEFPLFAAQMAQEGVGLLLVPSFTTSLEGFYRVFVSCRARALENQFFVVQSSMLGLVDKEMTYGAASICTPIDQGFPEDGVLKMGRLGEEELVIGDVDLCQLEKVRSKGQTRNFMDSKRWKSAKIPQALLDLR
ncbi:MAG: amidohydrolase [Verrucomicrobia bacterium]|nr:amidohydrolase [Verrucomicrobiota bacterium]